MTGTGTVDGFRGNDATAGSQSICRSAVDSFDNIDVLRWHRPGDTLTGPNLANHWDMGGQVSGWGLANSLSNDGRAGRRRERP